MKSLSQEWKNIREIMRGKPVALFLDFDGTLSPIVPRAAQAFLPVANKKQLERLKKVLRGRLAIVSGRSLKDVRKNVGLRGIIYVGNHGLEIAGPGIHFKAPGASSCKKTLKRLKKEIHRELGCVRGIFLEDKDLTMSLHYRMVKAKDIPFVQRMFRKTVRPYVSEKKIKVNTGKKVFEIRPPLHWHKGRAVLWLLRHLKGKKGKNFFPIYVGDDTTDEDAFVALRSKGLTVAVGRLRSSKAEYFLKDQKKVAWLLRKLAESNKRIR